MILLAAKFVGRWPSGAPLTLTPNSDSQALSDENRFVYMELDPNGYRCPIGAHIRRANPRDSRVNDTPSESMKTSSRHRLIRRGISYGRPLFDRAALDAGEAPIGLKDDGEARGLHFFAINANISRQFELLQQTWCNNATFNAEFGTTDPIVGCNDGMGVMTLPARPVRHRIRNVPKFVHVRGGAYLFLPGLSALRYLAKDAV
jgi:deferrochelatase/peroxidase EfeB